MGKALDHPGFERLGSSLAPRDHPKFKWRVDIVEAEFRYYYYGATPAEALENADNGIVSSVQRLQPHEINWRKKHGNG